jgi:IS30 family transposase
MRGHSCTGIAKSLNKNHSTIIHYMRNAEWLIKHDDDVKVLYEICVEYHDRKYDNKEEIDEFKLRRELVEKSKRIEQLSLQIEQLNQKLKQKKSEEERFEHMFAVLRNRVPLGKEKELTDKFNRVINGL